MLVISPRIPTRTVRWLLAITLTALTGVGTAAFSLETSWRTRRVQAEETQSKNMGEAQEQLASLTSAVTLLTASQAAQREELAEYRAEMRGLRKDQVEAARQIQRTLDALERRQ